MQTNQAETRAIISDILDEIKELEMLTSGLQDPASLYDLAVIKTHKLQNKYELLKSMGVQGAEQSAKEPEAPVQKASEEEAEAPVQADGKKENVEIEEEEGSRLGRLFRIGSDKNKKTVDKPNSKMLADEADANKSKAPYEVLKQGDEKTGEQQSAANTTAEPVESESRQESKEPTKYPDADKVTAKTDEHVKPAAEKEESNSISEQQQVKSSGLHDILNNGGHTTNDKFKIQAGVNETIQVKHMDEKFKQSLKNSLTLNDRIGCANELFGGDIAKLNNVIDRIDKMPSKDEAVACLKQSCNWDESKSAAAKLITLIENHFDQ